MMNWKKLSILPGAVILAIVFSGCGGLAYQTIPNGTYTNLPYQTNPTPTPTGTSTSTPDDPTYPSYNYAFRLQNWASSTSECPNPTPSGVSVGSYTTGNINTDTRLTVTLTSGSPSAVPCGAPNKQNLGFTAYYSCEEFTVSLVNDANQVIRQYPPVRVSLNNPTMGQCAGVPSSKTIDMSNDLYEGHGAMKIRVSKATYDNCRLSQGGYGIGSNPNVANQSSLVYFYPGYGIYYGGCTMTEAYMNHVLEGSLSISTNKTR